MKNTKAAGDRGEAETARYLRRRGYTLLASQWRCRFGELDLVARDRRGTVCFVEVKLRSNLELGLPREYVNGPKRERLRKAAACYLSAGEIDAPARFDVAEVYTDENGRVLRLNYLEDAFA
jgi:putative endonuclease